MRRKSGWSLPARLDGTSARCHTHEDAALLSSPSPVPDTVATVIVIGIIDSPNNSNAIVHTRGTVLIRLHPHPSLILFVALAGQFCLDNGTMAGNPIVKIELPGRSLTKPYTTGETIRGTVILESPQTIPFRPLLVWLNSRARTKTAMSIHPIVRTWHVPILRDLMGCGVWNPMPGEFFSAGVRYTLEFTYIIPPRLPRPQCYGRCMNPVAAERHCQLPPSLGDWYLKDMSPKGAQIGWFISVDEVQANPDPLLPSTKLACLAATPVYILPFCAEDPPRIIDGHNDRYKMCETTTLRRRFRIHKGPIGTLTATALQPPALMIHPDSLRGSQTVAQIDLSFSPSNRTNPYPKIHSLKIEIQSSTFYSSEPMHCLPDLSHAQPALGTANIPLEYSTSRTIATVFPDAPLWQCSHCTKPWDAVCSSLPSGSSSSSRPGPSDLGPGKDDAPTVGATEVPEAEEQQSRVSTKTSLYELPAHLCKDHWYHAQLKTSFGVNDRWRTLFLPTFFSCSIARTYTLKLTLRVGPTNHNMKFFVPLQVGVMGIGPYAHASTPNPPLATYDSATGHREVPHAGVGSIGAQPQRQE
ncbi:hypothetical protein VFPFJ_08122 [Purpureocillium lilacinum]|uniref:Arrestin-like N-terminal domain-containing protein n=1 Tax=Purpureocillium lilacinum TaxID=33203 RepID=A0A179H852_PURLI|nr:hypothetical protein VFPFJ_08122 [Purpureocillium lilacinum]OAQ85733.1 hypothetical protein VFPFJ_08122 [Purpureocillium lilacinum]